MKAEEQIQFPVTEAPDERSVTPPARRVRPPSAPQRGEIPTLPAAFLPDLIQKYRYDRGVHCLAVRYVSILRAAEPVQHGKLEIRAYPLQNIHAKVYIVTFKEGDCDGE